MWREPRPRVVIAGEALIDLIIQDGAVNPAAGGGQYNAARALARLGGKVEFMGRLSDDWFGGPGECRPRRGPRRPAMRQQRRG